jgi:hypothetical protein
MRCMQANLSYLTTVMMQKREYGMAGPVIMACPVGNDAALAGLYAKLQELFPGWRGQVKGGVLGSGSPKT